MKRINVLLVLLILLLGILPACAAGSWVSAGGGAYSDTISAPGYNITMWNTTGTTSWVVPDGVTEVEYLVVGGGGGGGGIQSAGGAGGGGAGAFRNATGFAVTGSLTVTVGAGGNGGADTIDAAGVGSSGGNSVFSTITSNGGGGGATYGRDAGDSTNGSGGGQSSTGGSAGTGGAYGHNGGTGVSSGNYPGGGGGGAGWVGGSATSVNGGTGGDGLASTITGASVIYAAGGGGGTNGGNPGAGGSSGVGGTGGDETTAATAGTANTGSGGGGGTSVASPHTGGNGGSGIVIIKFLSSDTTPPNSITNLANNTATCQNITWSWTNPTDADYAYLYVLKDNVWTGNYSNSTSASTWSGLNALTAYTFSSKTVDLTGNMNATWVNQTATTGAACPTPTPTPIPTPTICTAPTSPPWCAHQDIFLYSAYDDITGMRRMTNVPEINNTKTITSASITSSSGEVTLGTWLTPAFSSTDTTKLAPGRWVFRSYARASSDSGITQLKYRIFNRSSTGAITWLFYGNAFSKDIGSGTIATLYETAYARRNYTTMFAGDRLGIQINVSTDSAAARTVSYDVSGNTNASVVSVGYFLCSTCTAGAATTPTGTPAPFIYNPTTDKKVDYWKSITDWWWLPILIIFLIYVFRR